MNVNDLVTVVIQESTTQSTQANKATSRTNTSNLGGGALTGGSGLLGTAIDKVNAYSNIGFQTNSANNYQGTGTQSRNESFNTTISTRVIKFCLMVIILLRVQESF